MNMKSIMNATLNLGACTPVFCLALAAIGPAPTAYAADAEKTVELKVPEGTRAFIAIGEEGNADGLLMFGPDGAELKRVRICTPELEQQLGSRCERAPADGSAVAPRPKGKPTLDTSFEIIPDATRSETAERAQEAGGIGSFFIQPAQAQVMQWCYVINGFFWCWP